MSFPKSLMGSGAIGAKPVEVTPPFPAKKVVPSFAKKGKKGKKKGKKKGGKGLPPFLQKKKKSPMSNSSMESFGGGAPQDEGF